MSDAVVHVRGLQKTYKVHERETGVSATGRVFFKLKFNELPACGGIDLDIARSEIVGFLGPNGAGKTTTLKVLSGLLYPTGGDATVLGYTPWKREYAFLRRIALLMGHRTQLVWDIPAPDSFPLPKQIHGISDADFKTRLHELGEPVQ